MVSSRKVRLNEQVSNEYCNSLYSRICTVLDETRNGAQFRNQADIEEQIDQLREVLGLRDVGLAYHFLSQGLDARKAPAIELAPLALVAWASGNVTDAESAATIKAIHDTELFEFPAAWPVIQNWLDIRPNPELWNLWVDYTYYRLGQMTRSQRKALRRRLLGQARTVARASGGWMGIGSICREEQVIIDQIDRVFG